MKTIKLTVFLALLFSTSILPAQSLWTYFTPADFAARRARLMEKIGDGVAILQGAEPTEAYIKFRQDNNFYYLTGVEFPSSVLILNGKTKTATLLVPEGRFADIKDEALIKPGPDAAKEYQMTSVLPKSAMTNLLARLAGGNQTFYLVTSPGETAEMTRDRGEVFINTRLSDPWDSRISKEANFANKIKERFPLVPIKSLSPTLDTMRWVKDAKEIAVIKQCGKIGAHGFDEAMRVTRPGIYEYQVVAACDFVYQNEGAMGPS